MDARCIRTRRLNHKNRGPTITDLTEAIVMDILSRLPVKTIMNCRCVCKEWLDLLLNPYFAKIHFSRAPTQILGTHDGYDDYIFIGEVDESLLSKGKCINKKDICVDSRFMSIIKAPPCYGDCDVYNFANGFVCLAYLWGPCHIHNPITGQVIVVHQTERRYCRRPIVGFGLGFSRKTNELKLLRVVRLTGYYISDIYRLRTNSWTSIKGHPSGIDSLDIDDLDGPFVNGALHFKTEEKVNSIISFDFEEEKFGTVPGPPFMEERDYKSATLELFEGCLCMSYYNSSRCALDIWVMNEYGVEGSWTKRYVIDNVIEGSDYQPYRLTKNGEILVVCDGNRLISYDPKERSTRYIKFRGSYKYRHHYVVPFVPNFLWVHTTDQVEGAKC